MASRLFNSDNNQWTSWTRIDAFGCATPSALASLLGVGTINSTAQFGENIDNLVRFGQYAVSAGATGTKPTTGGLTLLVYGNTDYVAQLAIGVDNNKMYYRSKLNRTGQSWKTWMDVSTGIPDFYKNYADLASLASALGGAGLFTRSYNTGGDRILISGIINWSRTLLIVDIFNAANGNIVDRYAIVPNSSTYQWLVDGTVRVYSAGSRSAKVYLRCTTDSSSVLFIATQGRLSATITCNNYNNISISYEGDETQMTEKTF